MGFHQFTLFWQQTRHQGNSCILSLASTHNYHLGVTALICFSSSSGFLPRHPGMLMPCCWVKSGWGIPRLSNPLQVQECGHSWGWESSPGMRKPSEGGWSLLVGLASLTLQELSLWLSQCRPGTGQVSKGPKDAHTHHLPQRVFPIVPLHCFVIGPPTIP